VTARKPLETAGQWASLTGRCGEHQEFRGSDRAAPSFITNWLRQGYDALTCIASQPNMLAT
jgi:hypothetical protein